MPGRDIPLVNDQYYYVFNRGVASLPTFSNKRDYSRFIETMCYYLNREVEMRLSYFINRPLQERVERLQTLSLQKDFLVELISFCLMPNHFHLVVKQVHEGGIAKFIGNLTNSFTRYYNVKNERSGPLYQGKFKAVLLETNEQLLHVVRYVHINPYSSHVVKQIKDILTYPYSSMCIYLGQKYSPYVKTQMILDQFKGLEDFIAFTLDNADYQRQLENIKHLTLEK